MLWSNFKYIGVAVTPVVWVIFAAYSTGQQHLIKWRRQRLLFVLPIITCIVVFTNPLHRLFFPADMIVIKNDLTLLEVQFGVWFWVHAAYSYILLAAGVVLLLRHLAATPSLGRGRIIVLLIGAAIPWVANAITLTGVALVDLTPLGFVVTASALAWGMLRFHLLNIAPIARDALFNQMTDAILILDVEGRVIDVNDAARKALHLPPESGVGQELTKAVPQIAEAQSWITQARKSGFMMHEWTIADVVYDVRLSMLRDHNRRRVGYMLTLRDITQEKQAETRIRAQNQELQQTNIELDAARTKAEESSRLKTEFLSVMSHELRTPLNAIMGFTELQMMGAAGEPSANQKDFLRRTLSSANDLLELINNVIDLTRLEGERLPLANEPFGTADWWDGAIAIARKQTAKKGLEFLLENDPALPPILIGDAQRLQQALSILIANAVKFTDQGYIKVWSRRRDADWWEIGVEDSGVGVPAYMQSVIFESFRQVDSSSQRKYGGLGLGLALAHRLVSAMGGQIELESAEGKGSTFRLVLPIIEDVSEQTSTET
jgi:PAS domain S-box-containing protein